MLIILLYTLCGMRSVDVVEHGGHASKKTASQVQMPEHISRDIWRQISILRLV